MMTHKSARFTLGLLVVIIVVFLVFNRSSPSTFLYKNYTLRYDRGWDVLCDPYVIKKNDWIYKLFRQRGEIAHNDFPEFLRIFKRINVRETLNNLDLAEQTSAKSPKYSLSLDVFPALRI